jgi:hypothetical protein
VFDPFGVRCRQTRKIHNFTQRRGLPVRLKEMPCAVADAACGAMSLVRNGLVCALKQARTTARFADLRFSATVSAPP